MPRAYTMEKKNEVFRILAENKGHVMRTSMQTRVPASTIWYWLQRKRLKMEQEAKEQKERCEGEGLQQKEKNVLQQQQQQIELDDDYEVNQTYVELKSLRKRLMQHISDLTDRLDHADENINHRAIAITRLLDRLMKLDAQLEKMSPDNYVIYRVQYQYPDQSLHDMPIWANTEWLTENREEYDSHFPNNNRGSRPVQPDSGDGFKLPWDNS